jgi:adenylate cyclase
VSLFLQEIRVRLMEIPKLKQHLAVVFCDIAGTSQLMAREGDLVVADLLRAFFENAGRLGTQHHCELIKFIGDGFIAAFENASEVLPFFSAVQNLADTEPSIRGRQIRFQFSLHFGEVLCIETSYGKDILGDHVNIAARLNDLAEPGQIVISHVALEQMPAAQRALAGPSETAHVKAAGGIQIHRLALAVP